MSKTKKKKRIIKILYNPKFLFIIGLLIILLISIPLYKNISKKYIVDNEIKELENEIRELESKNKDFKNLISYLESDQFVEEQARLKLGLKKPGESVVVMKTDDSISSTTIQDNLANADIGNPQRWWDYFFN